MLNLFFGLLLFTADSQNTMGTDTSTDCSQFLNCSSCTGANCTWFKDSICNASKFEEPAQSGTGDGMQVLFTRNSTLCPFITSMGNVQGMWAVGIKGQLPSKKGKKGKMGNRMQGHLDIFVMSTAELGGSDCMGNDGDSTPFMRNGNRWQNPSTCALVMCSNGKLRMLDCPSLQCGNENRTCDPANRCLPKPCDQDQGRRLAADLGAPVVPVITPVTTIVPVTRIVPAVTTVVKTPVTPLVPVVTPIVPVVTPIVPVVKPIVPVVKTTVTPLVPVTTTTVTPIVPVVTPIVPVVATGSISVTLPVYSDCLAIGSTPALKHGESWKNPTTCDTYQCFNGIITSLSCISTICPNGDLRPCDPTNDCKPKECGADCPALGDFPFLRDNQTVYDPITCNRYTCHNRITTKETCLTATCANGDLRPCMASNNCQPLPCTTGTFLAPVILPGTYVASVILPGTWLTPVSSVATTTTTYILPAVFSADCPAHGLFPFLQHGEMWMDPLTCDTYSCNNGVTTSTSSCLRTVCPGGLLAKCDPLNNCFSSFCP